MSASEGNADIAKVRGRAGIMSIGSKSPALALQLPFLRVSESMGNHDLKIVDAGSVD